jgi:hypothetical protein
MAHRLRSPEPPSVGNMVGTTRQGATPGSRKRDTIGNRRRQRVTSDWRHVYHFIGCL